MKVEERFLKYVAFPTTSCESGETVPSTETQLKLAAYIAEELKAVGLSGVRVDRGYVYAYLPASEGVTDAPAIGLIAHMDTSDAVSGENIKPRKLHYEGGDIVLSEKVKIEAAKYENLSRYIGQDLIVTDGTTLLGADDKAGISEIVTACEYLIAHPEIRHGRICVGFTPDEEIGRGADCFDVPNFGADYAYTVDGGTLGELEYETFNAASAKVRVNGVSIHPGSAKDKMKNAVLIASEFIGMLPESESPAHTEGREGFYHVGGIEGNETLTRFGMIIRDHDMAKFEARKAFVASVASYLNAKYGEGTVEAEIEDSYYNMREKIEPCIGIVERAKDVFRSMGIEPIIAPVRGGTDGSRLSYMGLPCPNLSTGGENFHGVLEFVCIQSMEKMVEMLTKLVTVG